MSERAESGEPRPEPAVDEVELFALLRLLDVDGLGRSTLRTLLRRYGRADAALAAVLRGRTGLPRAWRERLLSKESVRAAATRRQSLDALGAGVLLAGRPGYPDRLERLPQPPVVLFFRGRAALLELPAVAIIGARRCTGYGREAAGLLAAGIARANVAVVSGLARGIDAAAHVAALEAGGATIAVVGTGLDVAYPRENATLQERIAAEGLLVSEYPPGQGPRKHHFPERNRLIVGLSRGMVVVEAGPRSGTHGTVEMALEQGVTAFAVPGPIGRPQSVGTHRMLRDGAALATSAEAVLEELELPVAPVSASPGGPALPIGDNGKRLLEALAGWEASLDEVAVLARLPMSEVLPLLLELELLGRVERRPGGRYAALPAPATPVAATG